MNEMIIIKKLLSGDKFQPEMHLKQQGFTYRACGSFVKKKIRIKQTLLLLHVVIRHLVIDFIITM